MVTATRRKTRAAVEKAACPHSPTGAHHWVIEAQTGITRALYSSGVCRHCGEERQFSNVLPDEEVTGTGLGPEANKRRQKQTRARELAMGLAPGQSRSWYTCPGLHRHPYGDPKVHCSFEHAIAESGRNRGLRFRVDHDTDGGVSVTRE